MGALNRLSLIQEQWRDRRSSESWERPHKGPLNFIFLVRNSLPCKVGRRVLHSSPGLVSVSTCHQPQSPAWS